jgi:hypothetical protein
LLQSVRPRQKSQKLGPRFFAALDAATSMDSHLDESEFGFRILPNRNLKILGNDNAQKFESMPANKRQQDCQTDRL